MKFEELSEAYSPLIEKLLAQSTGTRYEAFFLEPNPAAATDMGMIRSVYLDGILERSHLACITFLARTKRWLDGAFSQKQGANLVGFSAMLRGLLESAADAHDVMKFLPATIERMAPYMYLVSKNSSDVANVFVEMGELEQRLIHYAFAQRQPRNGPVAPDHHVKSNAEYIRGLESYGVPGATALYSELCELTHPAAASVSCFLDEAPTYMVFNPNRDTELIDELWARYMKTVVTMVQYSVNPALVTLALLRRVKPEWAALTDHQMSGIGTTAKRLADLDRFIATHVDGTWHPARLR